jgi:putative membrane protein
MPREGGASSNYRHWRLLDRGYAMYLWLKAFHIIAVIAWMAGMLYLPRLFVYHCAAEPGSPQSETFKVMEQRLLRFIINPAMIVTWVLGLWLAFEGGWITGGDAVIGFLWSGQGFAVWRAPSWGWNAPGWLLVKLALVIALSVVHGFFVRWVKDFAADRNTHTQKFYRIANEIPTVLMILIVLLVVLKPF